ncbi:MAG: hypothetical protein ACI9UA_005616 [Pseudoalteromonas tetraodonis]|jgi:hypothetical protein
MNTPIPKQNLHRRRQFLKAAAIGLGTSAIGGTVHALAQDKPGPDAGTLIALNTPLSPHLRSIQRLSKAPHAKSKYNC